MRQNPTREGLGVTFPGSFPISEDEPSDHGVEQVTVNPLERRLTNQGNKKYPMYAHTPPTDRNINGRRRGQGWRGGSPQVSHLK